MMRRLLALGAALVVLILIVLGVKGCLDARARGALSDYARSVEQIVDETNQTSKEFFGQLEDPGDLSVTEFTGKVDASRSAMVNHLTRVEGLSAPGEMSSAQKSLELVYELRAAAMETIAAKMPTALGEAGAPKATAAITRQMQKLLASDVIYESVTRPEINGTLESNGLESDEVPKSTFLPGGTKWLEESEVKAALGRVNGSSGGAASPGIHGLGLLGVGVGGSELTPEVTNTVVTEGTPEVEVQVQNQGESTENGITVVVVAAGKETTGEIPTLEAGAIETAVVPLTPAPKGETTLEVEVEPVPGEQVTENNEATYTVVFE
ncbi:MAG TPA: CARDB domain-containing protein [Solirubrobacterales bacterium]|nr:CARDB domain-containing protein [Solirubrobacterales bacterium]